MKKRLAAALMQTSAVLLGVTGLLLLFASDELASTFGNASELALSLWAAGLMGFAAMNWTGRSLPVGGIYGRAVVAGNQAHAFIGAMVLLRATLTSPASPLVIALLTLYVLLAAGFSYLLFRASGLED